MNYLSICFCIFLSIYLSISISVCLDQCSSNPCPAGITCVDIGDDFFCECQVCNCTADLVDKTCGTIPSKISLIRHF